MKNRLAAHVLLLAPLLLLLLASPTWARGGRYAGPVQRGPTSAEPTAPPGAPEVPAPDCPDPEGEPPEAPPNFTPPTPTLDGGPGAGRTARTGRIGVAGVGVTDWLHWYESRRERFEDFRAWTLRTEASPMFAVGDANGPAVGKASARVSDRVRMQILEALSDTLDPKHDHWIPTEAAAYVGLGKIATGRKHVAPHLAVLSGARTVPEYIRESAVLGLGHLARTDAHSRLPADLLDGVRDVLLDVLVDDAFGIRTRAFAGVSLGLLADQPSGRPSGSWTAEHLFRAWNTRKLPDEVQVGILVGLSRIDPDQIPRVIKLVLGGCAERGREWPEPASALVRANALVALARTGDVRSAPVIVGILERKSGASTLLKQAAALSAGILGERDARARRDLGRALLGTLDGRGEPGTRHLAWMALARLLAAEAADGGDDLVKDAQGGARLLGALKETRAGERAFVALALGVAVAPVDHTVDSGIWQGFRFDAVEALRRGVEKGADAHVRGAFAVGLGLAGDRQSGARLLEILRNDDADPEIRAYAALALGLTGDARQGVVSALTDALASPRSELLRMRAATSLGLLGGGSPAEQEKVLLTLVTSLRTTRSQAFKGQIAVTLGRIGDARAVKSLVAILAGEKEAGLNRAIACAALGLVGDEEMQPLLAETRIDSLYTAGANVIYELLDLL